MHHLRAWILQRRQLAMLAIALVLCIKALVPAGYMISSSPATRTLAISICAPLSGDHTARPIAIPMKDDKRSDHGKDAPGTHCPFSALSMAGMTGADPVLLAIAFAFILVLGLAPMRRLQRNGAAYLLPPLRGPPAPC